MVEEKEAIERLYNMKNKVDVALMNSKHEKGDWLYDDVQGTADTLRMAINALEKQVKKQITRSISKEEENRAYYYCTICCKWLTRMTNYCPNCGQKLDWSDKE